MTRVLIVSDSHGSSTVLEDIKQRHKGEAEVLIHCGDSELPKDDKAMSGFHAVRGNCDFDDSYPETLLTEAAGRRILVTHGHLYSVKTSLMKLSYLAAENNADIVCFGHSHLLGAERINSSLFINPGSILLPRGRREKTYVILSIEEDHAMLHVYDQATGREINDLKQTFPF